MIIQKVIKGITGLQRPDVDLVLAEGILSNWMRKLGSVPLRDIPAVLTPRNLDWHQNHYGHADPAAGGEAFKLHTPYISTTAGTVERDVAAQRNVLHPAWIEALGFATDFGRADGWLFYCDLWTLGKQAVGHGAFAEELRELNVHTAWSIFQTEGEVAAKVFIPPAQISHAEWWEMRSIRAAAAAGRPWAPSLRVDNPLYVTPESYHNVREVLQ
jgi:hypothetical protein